ncbi:MAG: phytoene desaturase [Bacteroidales bacterium]|nr:phytoene desaturase [Bacteroidales bacterium]
MAKRICIAGAGLGGLAAALRLVKKGYDVTILEKNPNAGGRLNQIKKDGFTFDTGPSFFSMTYEFDEFARDCGITLPFKFIELDPLYTVNFLQNGKTYRIYKDISRFAAQFKDVETGFEHKMKRYLEKSRQLFEDTYHVVIKTNHGSLFDYLMALSRVNPKHLPIVFSNFWQHVSRYFSSDDARQIISLVAFFLGRTPFDTHAVYSLLSHTEFVHNGYYNVEGGMYRIVETLVEELKKGKVRFAFNTEITGYHENAGLLSDLTDHQGKNWEADAFVINADAALFRGMIFNRPAFSTEKLDRMEWTMGSLTIYLGIKGKIPQAEHHNYYLGKNYKDYAKKILINPGKLEKPYYYVNVLSKLNPGCAPPGCESIFIVCPVPHLGYKKNWDDVDLVADSIIADFSARINRNISKDIISKTVYTPVDWQNKFNLFRGSGLGLSPKMMQTGGFRPRNHDERYRNVFYAGASTIPGTGLPMVIISSKFAVERVEKYFAA